MICTVIDIETTGRYKISLGLNNPDYAEILEVSYIRVNSEDLSILSHGSLYFYKPYFCVESQAQEVHGLTRQFLKQYEKDFDKNLIQLHALMQQTLIVGKNSDVFDIPFIQAFLKKHSNGKLNIDAEFEAAKIKTYAGYPAEYTWFYGSYDIQTIYKNTWKDQVEKMTGSRPSGQRKGSLSEYIDDFPGRREEVEAIYATLDKDRVTKAHGALYDCVMTYVVLKDCVARGLSNE